MWARREAACPSYPQACRRAKPRHWKGVLRKSWSAPARSGRVLGQREMTLRDEQQFPLTLRYTISLSDFTGIRTVRASNHGDAAGVFRAWRELLRDERENYRRQAGYRMMAGLLRCIVHMTQPRESPRRRGSPQELRGPRSPQGHFNDRPRARCGLDPRQQRLGQEHSAAVQSTCWRSRTRDRCPYKGS